jgi:hypothetical protein
LQPIHTCGEVWGKACEVCGGEDNLEEDYHDEEVQRFMDMGKRNLWILYNETLEDEDYPGRTDELQYMEAALDRLGISVAEGVMDEDFLAPPKDVEHGHYEDEGEDDDDWDMRDAPELDRQTNFDAPSRYDGDDSYDMYEQGPEDEFDVDPDAMVDVGDDEDYEVFDFEDEFDAMMGNTTRFESVEDRKAAGLAPIEEAKPDFLDLDDDGDTEEDMKDAAEDKEKVEEGEGDTCSRCRKGKMERGETFFGPAERCNHCNYQRQLSESAPHGSDEYEFFSFDDDKAYFLVADEIGDRIIFGMNNEVGVPEQYVDGIVALLKDHGFEAGQGYKPAGMEENLQNGYGEHEYADAYDDYFPLGSHQTPSDDLGPTASGYGDNAMDNKMRSKDAEDVYESMRQKYRRYRLS